MTDDIATKVVAIIAEQAMVESEAILPDTKLEELGLDSLGMVEVVFGIEEAFDISVPYNANDPTDSDFDLSNVGSVISAVQALVAAKEQA